MDVEHEIQMLRSRVAALEATVGVNARPDTPSPVPASAGAPTEPLRPPGAPVILPAGPPAGAPTTLPTPPPAHAPTSGSAATHRPPPPLPKFPPPQYPPRQPPQPPPPLGQSPIIAGSQPSDSAAMLPSVRTPFEWGIEAVLRWAGVALLTLAGVFLVSTAISRGWIGPELQLLAAALAGGAMLGGAVHLGSRRPPWAVALGSGGSIVLGASALATHHWLDLVGPRTALAFFAGSAVLSCGIADRLRMQTFAVVAALVAMLAPLDTVDQVGDGALAVWVAAGVAGAAAWGLTRRWPGLRHAVGWLGAFLLLVISVMDGTPQRDESTTHPLTLASVLIVAVLLWAAPAVTRRIPPGDSGSWGGFGFDALDVRSAAAVPLWTWACVAGLASGSSNGRPGVLALVIAAVFGLATVLAWAVAARAVALSWVLGAVSLATVGLAVEFDGPALLTALTLQAVTSFLLGRWLQDRTLQFAAALVGAFATWMAVVAMLQTLEYDGFATVGDAGAALLVVACWVAATVTAPRVGTAPIPKTASLIGAWTLALLWTAAALLGAPQGVMLISLVWAVMAASALVYGLIERQPVMRNLAMATLGITLCKLVFIDMAEVDVFWRVGLFGVVGLGLIGLGLKVPALVAASADAETA